MSEPGRSVSVHVGKQPSEFQRWNSTFVHFHRFADLTTEELGESVDSSPEFTCLGHRWKLFIYMDENLENDWVEVDLFNMSEKSIEISFLISVRNLAGKEVPSVSFDTKTFCPCGLGSWCWADKLYAKRSTLLTRTLVEGTLTFEVLMKKPDPTSCSSVAFIPKNPIRQSILQLFMDEGSADVVFETGGTSPVRFFAHRLILQKCAPQLAEIFGEGTPGNVTCVSIPDDKPEIFRHMLYYIYGGEADQDLVKNSKDIIDVADKFGVASLKLEAEAFFVKTNILTIDNVMENLLYAESKNCALLKEAVMDFILENRDEISSKVSFEDVPGTMITDLLAAFSRGKKESGSTSSLVIKIDDLRVGTLRKMLHDTGLDVDGSRETMIARLKETACDESSDSDEPSDSDHDE